jgi:hypothetical protein
MWWPQIEMQGDESSPSSRSGERIIIMRSQPEGGEGVDSDRELILEDARSIVDGLWRMAQLA